ncbi:MAG: hypothetical protein ACJAZF_003571, partial [Granulosicoccus sp.]
ELRTGFIDYDCVLFYLNIKILDINLYMKNSVLASKILKF